MTSTPGISQPRSVDLLLPTLQTIPEAIGKNIAIARARIRSRIMAAVKADGYGHGTITVARAAIAAGAEWLGTTDVGGLKVACGRAHCADPDVVESVRCRFQGRCNQQDRHRGEQAGIAVGGTTRLSSRNELGSHNGTTAGLIGQRPAYRGPFRHYCLESVPAEPGG